MTQNPLHKVAVYNDDPVKTKALFDKYYPGIKFLGGDCPKFANSLGYYFENYGCIDWECACPPGYTPVDSSYNPEPVLKAGDRVMTGDNKSNLVENVFLAEYKEVFYCLNPANGESYGYSICIPYVAEQPKPIK